MLHAAAAAHQPPGSAPPAVPGGPAGTFSLTPAPAGAIIIFMFETSTWANGPLRFQLATGPANGPPLLFLHGVLRAWTDFSPLWPVFAPGWRLHALDLRGHGGSSRAPSYLVTDYAGDVAAFVRARFQHPVVIYGHSLGALVAAAVAADVPELVQGVILEDPPAPSLLANVRASPYHALWSAMQGLATDRRPVAQVARDLSAIRVSTAAGAARLGELRDAAQVRYMARCLRDAAPAVLTPLLEGRLLDGHDVAARWAGVRCPALLLRGDEALGGMLGRAEAEGLMDHLADGLLVDVPGAGHLIHWTATEATARLCLAFLESLV